jgi:hypothetical protein
MINDKLIRSTSAYTMASEMATKTNPMLENTAGISAAIAKSTDFMRSIENVTKYTSNFMPMLDTAAWLKNDVIDVYSNSVSAGMAYSTTRDYPKLLTIPQWILDLNNTTTNALNGVFAVQNTWQMIMPAIPENYLIKNSIDIAAMFKDVNAASRSMADVIKISESISKFDSSINHLYKFINGFDQDDDDFEVDINSQLTIAFNSDLEGAITEDRKIVMVHAFQNLLDSLITMSIDFTLEQEQKLFLSKLKNIYDEWKKNGMLFNSIMFSCCRIQPVIQHYHNEIFNLEEDKLAVIINQSKVENNYITESSIQVFTTNVKFLKERPDNRLKPKFVIPIGTKINIVQDNGKWIKVKFISDCVYYSGWTLNNNL